MLCRSFCGGWLCLACWAKPCIVILCTNITMFWLIESADLSYNHNLNGFYAQLQQHSYIFRDFRLIKSLKLL